MNKDLLLLMGIILFVITLVCMVFLYFFVYDKGFEQGFELGDERGFKGGYEAGKKLTITRLPECYISTEDCINYFDNIGFYSADEQFGFKQCCKEPHYVLQDISAQLINDAILHTSFADDLLWQYNCTLSDEWVRCLYPSDCRSSPELEGCEKDEGNRFCCFDTCTLSVGGGPGVKKR